MELTLAELDLLLLKVTQGDQTRETFRLAERIRDAQTNAMVSGELKRRGAISTAARAAN